MNTLEVAAPSVESALERESRARAIAGKGGYERIVRELEMEGLLEDEVARVTEEYREVFDQMPDLTERDAVMFTVIELYDPGTARHCAETYRIARRKIERPLSTSRLVLGRLFEREVVSTDEFYRACLLHDIGKVEIPRAVIQHRMNDDEMELCLRDLVLDQNDPGVIARLEAAGGEAPQVSNAEELTQYLSEHHLRSVHFIPSRLVLTPEELSEVEERGFSGDMSLMEIIKKHEEFSREILLHEGCILESQLAGAHHNYHGEGTRHSLALGALHLSVDMSELLHIADVEQALSATRSYKKGFSLPRVLRIIMEETQAGRISPEAAYLWVDDELSALRLQDAEPLSLDDSRDVRIVRSHLERIRREIDMDPLIERYQNAA